MKKIATFLIFSLCIASPAFAQAKKVKAPTSSMEGEAKKIKVMEKDGKKVKYADKTDVNFDDALIEGAAKSPFMQMLGSRDGDFNKGFIKIRYEWHDQLIMSVSGLSQ